MKKSLVYSQKYTPGKQVTLSCKNNCPAGKYKCQKSAFTHSTVHDLFEGSKRRGNADASKRGEKGRLSSKPDIGE